MPRRARRCICRWSGDNFARSTVGRDGCAVLAESVFGSVIGLEATGAGAAGGGAAFWTWLNEKAAKAPAARADRTSPTTIRVRMGRASLPRSSGLAIVTGAGG